MVEKVPGAEHPLVAAKRAKGHYTPGSLGIGVVYDKDGVPKIDPDFIVNLNPVQRRTVENNLRAHGWQLKADNTVEKI